MTSGISDLLLSQLSDFVASRIGLHFPPERWPDLGRRLDPAVREFGFSDTARCLHWLLSSPLTRSQVEVLASHLTVGETYFFRDQRTFELLESHIFPEMIRARRGVDQRLRIWSAGCATGEEPYSIAIALHKLIPDLERWNITILATDINPRFLQRASQGTYADWSFRGTPSWVRERYFRKAEQGRLQVLPAIQKMVAFSHLNLAMDPYPSLCNNTNAMDVVFCRNVLMYFAADRQKQVADKFHHALVEGGWLIVSPGEASHVVFSQFAASCFPSAILYRKESGAPSRMSAILPDLHEEPTPWPQSAMLSRAESERALVPEPCKADVEPDPYQQALSLYQQGRYSEAAGTLTLRLSLDQNDANAMGLLARVYANQGRLSEALQWCEKALAADRLNTGRHYLRAIILQEQGAAEEARASLQRALYLDPNFVMAHFGLGNLALRQGKTKEAGKHFENSLSLLRTYQQEDTLPESEGITAGRLIEIIRSTSGKEQTV